MRLVAIPSGIEKSFLIENLSFRTAVEDFLENIYGLSSIQSALHILFDANGRYVALDDGLQFGQDTVFVVETSHLSLVAETSISRFALDDSFAQSISCPVEQNLSDFRIIENRKNGRDALLSFLRTTNESAEKQISEFRCFARVFFTKSDALLCSFEDSVDEMRGVEVRSSNASYQANQNLIDFVPLERICRFKKSFSQNLVLCREKVLEWESDVKVIFTNFPEIIDRFIKLKCVQENSIGSKNDENSEWNQVLLFSMNFLNELKKLQFAAVVLEETLCRCLRDFNQLAHIPQLSSSYLRASEELSRRASFNSEFSSKIEEAQKKLDSLREEENSKRMEFFSNFGKHLPASLLPELRDLVPPVGTNQYVQFDSLSSQQ